MTNTPNNSFRDYNNLIETSMRRAHIERSRAFYDFWGQMSNRLAGRNKLSDG